MEDVSSKQVWISYNDEKGNDVQGYFNLMEQTSNYIKIESRDNIITIPYHKINKIKENKTLSNERRNKK